MTHPFERSGRPSHPAPLDTKMTTWWVFFDFLWDKERSHYTVSFSGLYERATEHRRHRITWNGFRLWQRSPHVSLPLLHTSSCFSHVLSSPSQGPSFMSPRLSGSRQRLFASHSAVLSPFSENISPALQDHHETPRRALLPTFCRCMKGIFHSHCHHLTHPFQGAFS